jgi:poly(A) polymerase Pap1
LVAIFEKHPKVEEVFPIPMALVPLIKIKFHSIQFDILMSQIDTALLDLPYEKFFAENTLDEIPDK